jgi:hypothetical protein
MRIKMSEKNWKLKGTNKKAEKKSHLNSRTQDSGPNPLLPAAFYDGRNSTSIQQHAHRLIGGNCV